MLRLSIQIVKWPIGKGHRWKLYYVHINMEKFPAFLLSIQVTCQIKYKIQKTLIAQIVKT